MAKIRTGKIRRTMGKRTSTSWARGRSGNPRGRPRHIPDGLSLRDLARQHTGAAVGRLVELLDCDQPSVAVRAAEALLDRGWGRPAQMEMEPEEVSGPAPTNDQRELGITPEEALAASHAIMRVRRETAAWVNEAQVPSQPDDAWERLSALARRS